MPMNRQIVIVLLMSLGLAYGLRLPADPPTHFELPSTEGKQVPLSVGEETRFTVLCFLGAECPLAKLYAPRLEALRETFEPEGVRFFGISSNRQDSLTEMKRYAAKHSVVFPILKDHDNIVADYYQATRTPEVVVLDRSGTVRYRGRIDDQYEPGVARTKPAREDLAMALRELLAGKTVSVSTTEPAGCLIGKLPTTKTPTKLTYCNKVSRILKSHCVECHRPGEIGPFSLTEYEEILGWGAMLIEVIDQGRMPPWHANPNVGHFTNARHMPDEDKAALREWVQGGMPYGDPENLPDPLESVADWQLPREPDQIISMSDAPFSVPAEGVVEYQYFVVDPGFTEDRWISGAQVIPGNAEVVHHCIVFIRPPDGGDFCGAGFLTGYVPGQRTAILPEGHARKVPAGSRLVFQMHYTPTGTAASDLTKIGLLFADEESVTHEVITLTALNQDFEIPPGAANYAVPGKLSVLPNDGKILAITPHMHYRGKSFRVWSRTKENTTALLDVPRYDFNWQHIYELAEPVELKGVDELRFQAVFDNSKNNPFNPDPTRHVTWGDQTWEEMAIAFFEVALPRGRSNTRRRKSSEKSTDIEKTSQFVESFFREFDNNNDGVIRKSELPLSQQRFGFRRFDADGNGELSREEIEIQAKKRRR